MMPDDVKISIHNRREGARHLYESSFWEVPGLNPFAPGKRVKRKAGLPMWLPDAVFAPRRAVK